jgi:catecholate siderophore receptor
VRVQLNVENLPDEGFYASAHSNSIMPGAPRLLRLGFDWRF